jgi:hypothetical protein
MKRIPYLIIALALLAMIFGALSCNTEKRALKKSDKHFFKSMAWDKPNTHMRCSEIAPPIIMTKDSFIYKQGKTIYKAGEPVYVEVDCDTVKQTKLVRIKCPPCDSVRIDTAYISVRNTEVDRNKEIAQAAIIAKQSAKIASQKTQLNIGYIVLAIIALYYIIRFAIRKFSN